MLHETDLQALLRLHRSMFLAREIDRVEAVLIKQGMAHFHVSGAGHETTALLADFLTPDDWLHLHYRDKALLLARGLPIAEFFRGLLATGPSHSAGRQMSAHFAARELNVASMVGPVGNNALHAVGNAQAVKHHDSEPIVLCCVGDGTTQQGEFLEALAEAVRTSAPVLFVVENNRWAISTDTIGQTFFDLPGYHQPREIMGLPIVRVDGSNLEDAREVFGELVSAIRDQRRPCLVVLGVERLTNHTNADDQQIYRTAEDIAASERRDPLQVIRAAVSERVGVDALSAIETKLIAEVAEAADAVRQEPAPTDNGHPKAPYPTDFQVSDRGAGADPTLTMREAINGVLASRLAADKRVTLLGQDIEDPKGDVFGVTKGLSTAFPGRVRNAPLSESTIVGTAVGRALAGDVPVAFLQFADFLPLAFNQIISEMGSMYWRTKGAWQAPVIVMVSCGGYKPGLGPFHAQSLESVMAHTPGIDVVMPSSAADAAGLLNAAFDSGRPTVFLYPKSTLNLSDRKTTTDLEDQFVQPGRARMVRTGSDITLVTYGNPLSQCLLVADRLEQEGFSVDLIDLRSISPWDEDAVVRSVRRTKRLIVVHEDNKTAGFGAEVLAVALEKAGVPFKAARVARADTHIPFHFDAQIATLPSYRSVLTASADLLGCDLQWIEPKESSGPVPIEVIGSGPADDEVEIIELHVRVGDTIAVGQLLAVAEATKAAVEIEATIAGQITEVLGKVGGKIAVGSPLVLVEAGDRIRERKASTAERIDQVVLHRRPVPVDAALARSAVDVGIAGIAGVTGSRLVHNDELTSAWPGRTSEDVVNLTGIETRRWVDAGETVETLAIGAARKLLADRGLTMDDIDLVVAATGTPDRVTPSLACRVTAALTPSGRGRQPAYDINAACSGYLFALAHAHDHIQVNPQDRVLVITSEVLSPFLNRDDFNTAVIFADAATATLISAVDVERPMLRVPRPVLAGSPEPGNMLSVPIGSGHVQMAGREVFADAVRAMAQTMNKACEAEGVGLAEVDLMVPHQANQRIIDAVAKRSGRPAFSVIRHLGNTSSSSIPLALIDAVPGRKTGEKIGLVAFGGGLTYAAAVATVG